jgi:hypothetical protein
MASMTKKWLAWINLFVGGMGIIFLLVTCWLMWRRPSDFPVQTTVVRNSVIPKGGFSRPKEDYDAINSPALVLRFSPMGIQLPDLRRFLVYYGKNGRPDANEDRTLLHFAFAGNKTPSSVAPGEPLYVLYDKTQTPPQYIFSHDNIETSLWIEANSQGNQAHIKGNMRDAAGRIIREPAACAEFSLQEKEFVRFGGTAWELGKWRVDGTLLARQKARWCGLDLFLERHGGEEYQDFQNKQRIDFGEGDDIYSIYVGKDDCMIWEEDHWHVVKPGKDSLGHPLLCVKKIDDRLMNLELWDIDGKGKIVLNLLKSNETVMAHNIQQNFKFVGARTRSQFVFEIDKERMLLSPKDWLLLTESGWKKLVTPEEIDAYVERKITGVLFVFDGIERKEDRQVIVGTMFNAARTDMSSVELPIYHNGNNNASAPLVNSHAKNPISFPVAKNKKEMSSISGFIPRE